LNDDVTPLERLNGSLARLRASGDARMAANELCDLLAASFGSTPRYAVPRSDFPSALDAIRELALAIGAAELHEACVRHDVPVALAHWLLAVAAPDRGYATGADAGAVATHDGVALGSLGELVVLIETTRVTDGDLVVEARVAPTVLFDEHVTFEAEFAGSSITLTPTGEYAGWRLFGHELLCGAHLHAVFPRVADGSRTGDITFRARWTHGGACYTARLSLDYGPYSHLTPGMRWRAGTSTLAPGASAIHVSRPSGPQAAWAEVRLIAKMIVAGSRTERRAGLTRAAFHATRPLFVRQNIWLTHDKMYSAGDNGEYMYRHLEAHRRGFTPYYAINRDAPEVSRLRAQGARLVHPGTLRHRLVYLNARVILTTQANPLSYNGLGGKPGALLRDLFDARIVCIQHGLSMQDIASFMHRSHAGIERYYCASPYEVANLEQAAYGYAPEQLVLTGIPRFDGLQSDPRRRLLIAPTWRPEFSGAVSAMNKPRPAASGFQDSPFLDLYGKVMTDERLLECARETGYSIDFLLHPYVAANSPAFAQRIADASRGSDVSARTVVPGVETPYEELLEQSDLLVTDFSGVQYDFAYMGKPVVYFHPPALPAQYGHGAMDYATMGFGEVTADLDELVRTLCAYLRRDCAITPEYSARIERFFAYRDGDSCARILADLAPYAARYV
jgi:hypothetical protein